MHRCTSEDLFLPIKDIQSGNKKQCQFPYGDVAMTRVPWPEETKIQGINEDKNPLLKEGPKLPFQRGHEAMPEWLVGLRNSWNSRSGSWYLTTWDSYKPNQFINHSSIIKITAVAAAATIQWVTALCRALHQDLRVHDLSKECCLLPHSSQVALSHLEMHFPSWDVLDVHTS